MNLVCLKKNSFDLLQNTLFYLIYFLSSRIYYQLYDIYDFLIQSSRNRFVLAKDSVSSQQMIAFTSGTTEVCISTPIIRTYKIHHHYHSCAPMLYIMCRPLSSSVNKYHLKMSYSNRIKIRTK